MLQSDARITANTSVAQLAADVEYWLRGQWAHTLLLRRATHNRNLEVQIWRREGPSNDVVDGCNYGTRSSLVLLYPDKSMRDEDVFNQRDRLCVTIENVMPPATYALPAAAKNGDVMGSMMGRVRLRPSPPAIALSTPVLPLTEPLQGPTILAPKRTALARIHSQVTRLSASVASVFSLKSKHKRHTTVQCSASSIFSFNINAIGPSSVPSLSLASPLSPAQPRSAGMNVHARPRWSASRPGRPKCAAASHFQQNPRWRSAIREGARRAGLTRFENS